MVRRSALILAAHSQITSIQNDVALLTIIRWCREFVPAILDIIAVDESAEQASNKAKELVAAMRDNMQEFLLYGIPKQELEEAMMSMFKRADVDGSGQLDKKVRSTTRGLQ
jgi:hypothetical protein